MNGFFEDLEDGMEPVEADYAPRVDGDSRWAWLEHLLITESVRGCHQRPDLDTLVAWLTDEAGCEATDGCWVEEDGTCPHGHESWFLVLGLI